MRIRELTSEQKKILYLILLLSFAVRLILVFVVSTSLKSDSVTYHRLALSILEGEYSLDGRATAFVVCGYPAFLSGVYFVFGEGQFFVKLIQSLLEVFTCLFFFKVSMKFLDVKYSLISLAVFAFFPSNILFSQAILTESLFGFFAIVVLYLCIMNDFGKITPGHIFITGIFFGLAIIVRSSFSFAVILLPLYFLVNRKKLFGDKEFSKMMKYSFCFLAGLMIILSPWLIRNKIVMNSFTLATQGGSTLWEGNNPLATGTWNSEAVNSNPLFDDPDEIQRDRKFYDSAFEFIANNPGKFFVNGFRKLGYLFSSERMALLYFEESRPGESSTEVYRRVNPLLLLLVNVPYFSVMIFGMWGLLLLGGNRFFMYGFPVIWMLTIFIFVGLARYHYVLIPFFIIGAVNYFSGKKSFGTVSIMGKAVGIIFTLFLISVWTAEIYLFLK